MRSSLTGQIGATLLILLFLAAAELGALDPRKQIGQYGHDRWTAERGLPGEAVYQILQSKDGYLWIRTGSGLSRFDGVRFVSVDAEIGSAPVKAICMSADGDLLIQTMMRTVVYKDGQFSDYLPPGPVAGADIRAVFESRERELFVGENNFIYRLARTGEAAKLRQGTAWVNAIFEDHAGNTWIAASPSLFSYRAGQLSEPYDTSAFGSRISAIAEDHLHRLWAGTSKGLFRFDGIEAKSNPVRQPGIPDLVTAVLEDRQGNLWVGTETAGLIRLKDNQVSSLNYVTGLTDENVLSLLEDREGSVWIGTANGLDRLRDTDLTTFTTREGLPSNRVNSVTVAPDGALEVFSDNGGLARIQNDQVKVFDQNSKLPSLGGSALFESRDGSLWIGTLNGLTQIKDGKVTVYNSDANLAHHYTSAISEDNESLIVANSAAGVVRFRDGKVMPFTIHGKETVLTQNSAYVSTIYCDPADTIWFGTAAGLFRQPADESHPGSWQAKVNFIVTSIYDDRQGNLWLGGLTPGLVQFRLSDGRVTHFRKRDGLFDGFLSKVLGDDQGNLWISTDHGIYSVRVRALEDFADGNSTFIPSRRFDLGDGMKTTVASDPGSQPAGARTPDGRLWFATVKGVVAVDPGHLMRNLLIPPVYVESVAADGVERRLGNSLEIAPGVKAIEIHYTALSLQIPERVRFRYQLEGFDHDWVDAGTRRVAYYMNLPPGTYRFHVIACNNDGLWNELGSIVTLVLKPHFYQTRLFFVACILLALLVAAGANMSYTRVIRERAKYLSTLVEERTAQLVESHRELEQLAHFDALTSLPNRRKFVEDFRKVLAQRRGREDGFALLLIDFDRFKKINDTFGHDAGDAFLVEASKRLSMVVRSSDAVARLGGDEFAVLLTGGHDEAVIATVCDRIVESFTTPVYFAGVDITTTVSVGVAVCPQHGNSEDELYKSADLALYDAKRMGRSKWRRYGQEAQERPSEPGVAASGAHGSTG